MIQILKADKDRIFHLFKQHEGELYASAGWEKSQLVVDLLNTLGHHVKLKDSLQKRATAATDLVVVLSIDSPRHSDAQFFDAHCEGVPPPPPEVDHTLSRKFNIDPRRLIVTIAPHSRERLGVEDVAISLAAVAKDPHFKFSNVDAHQSAIRIATKQEREKYGNGTGSTTLLRSKEDVDTVGSRTISAVLTAIHCSQEAVLCLLMRLKKHDLIQVADEIAHDICKR